MKYLLYTLLGTVFGFALVKSEAASWYRAQEMFHFQNFHMFGIIGSALVVGIIGVWVMRRLSGRETLEGPPITVPTSDPRWKTHWKRYLLGGALFGLGWGVVGLCPGTIFALTGAGITAAVVVMIGAVAGTYLYAANSAKIPH